MNFLSLDIGTTCCKYQLFSDDGKILSYKSIEYSLKKIDNELYVDVEQIFKNVKSMLKDASSVGNFSSVCISTIGESFVLLDENDEILFLPMLYTDNRGEKEAQIMLEKFGAEFLFSRVGVLPQSMYSISKLLWIKNNCPNQYKNAKKVMLMCDYIGYLLTGQRVIDYSLASRTGAFNIYTLEFDKEILNELEIPLEFFSQPQMTGSIVGEIKSAICNELNLEEGCKLVLGSHDQICATLGAGVIENGDAADGMGTVECITAVFDKPINNVTMGYQGYPCVPFAKKGLYCTYILNYSNASIVNWFKNEILHKYCGNKDNFFDYIEEKFTVDPSNILVLPYFNGCATPYQDINAKGLIMNLTTRTTDSEIYQGILESTACEMTLNAEIVKEYGIDIKNMVVSGGGANSKKWLQIKANIQNLKIKTLRSSEGGLCGCAMLQAVAMGKCKSLQQAKEIFVQYTSEFLPNEIINKKYKKQYEQYKKIYKTIKEII